jgi:hypothetical protein
MFHRLSTLVVCVLALCCSHFARAEDPKNSKTANLFAALDVRGIPQNLRGKDLTAAWRMMRATGSSSALESARLLQMLTHSDSSVVTENVVFYTRGDVISVGSESYLAAYRVEAERDPQKLQRQQRRAQLRATRNEAPDTRIEENASLVLSLLNLKAAGNLTDIRAFDPERDLLTEAAKLKNKVLDAREDSQMNLKQMALALKQYVQDYDEFLPPMRAAQSAEQIRAFGRNGANWNTINAQTPVQIRLYPYARSVDIFLHPGTGRPYLPNWRISRMSESQIENPAQTVLFYEDAPDSQGKRNVAFEDGHVEAVDEEKWKRLAKAAKLPP